MDFFEPLPESCPPTVAKPYLGDVCRLTATIPAESDFLSHRHLNPNKHFHTTECRTRSLSVFKSIDAVERIRALPAHNKKSVAVLRLDASSGVTMQTGNDTEHLSWWRSATFDPLGAIIEVIK